MYVIDIYHHCLHITNIIIHVFSHYIFPHDAQEDLHQQIIRVSTIFSLYAWWYVAIFHIQFSIKLLQLGCQLLPYGVIFFYQCICQSLGFLNPPNPWYIPENISILFVLINFVVLEKTPLISSWLYQFSGYFKPDIGSDNSRPIFCTPNSLGKSSMEASFTFNLYGLS